MGIDFCLKAFFGRSDIFMFPKIPYGEIFVDFVSILLLFKIGIISRKFNAFIQ